MKNSINKIILGIALMLSLSSGSTANTDGNKLSMYCQEAVRLIETGKTESKLAAGICLGMVDGTKTTLAGYSYEVQDDNWKVCFPDDNVTSDHQAIKIVLKYLRDNPADLHKPGPVLIIFALRNAYPCT